MYESELVSPAWLAILILPTKGIFHKNCHARVDDEHWQNDRNPLAGAGCAHARTVSFTGRITPQRHGLAYLVRGVADGLDVGFSPFSGHPTSYLTVVHVIARDLRPSSCVRLLPSKNH